MRMYANDAFPDINATNKKSKNQALPQSKSRENRGAF